MKYKNFERYSITTLKNLKPGSVFRFLDKDNCAINDKIYIVFQNFHTPGCATIFSTEYLKKLKPYTSLKIQLTGVKNNQKVEYLGSSSLDYNVTITPL